MPDPSPWTLLDSRVLLRDRWISLRADTLRNGRGAELSPWYVLDYPDWAAVVPLTDDGRIVLVRQWRHAAGAWCLELPGGVMEPQDADAVATVRRELREETGHAATGWQYLYASYPNPSIQTNRLHVVLATGVHPAGPVAHDDGEDIRVECPTVEEVLRGVGTGMLHQAMHVGALLVGLAAAGRIKL